MKSNAEIRRESFARLRQGKWFLRLFFLTLLFGVLQQTVALLLNKTYARFGLQTWMDFAQAKVEAMKGGLDFAVPSKAVMMQMHEATAFWLFISLIFAGITYLGLATVNIKAAKDDPDSCYAESFGALARPLGCGWLAFVVAVRVALWSLLLLIPGIVASYRYSQVWNVKAEHSDWSASRCIDESARLMAGRKMQRFRLDLFFVMWVMLGVMVGLAMGGLLPGENPAIVMHFIVAGVFFVFLWMAVARAVFYRALCDTNPSPQADAGKTDSPPETVS